MERRIVSSLRVRASFVAVLAAALLLAAGGPAFAAAQSTPTPSPAAPESGQLPKSESDAPQGGAVTPIPTAQPTTAPPAATPAPAAAAPTPTPTPAITHTGHRSLTIPAIILALAGLGALALALFAVAGRRSPGVRHAWREAAFRTRGTWADFSDWLRLGR